MRIVFILFCVSINSLATTVTWNLKNLYGVDQIGFSRIISDARNYSLNAPNDTIIVTIDAGTYIIGGNGNAGINFGNSGLNLNGTGGLIFKGAGMNQTTLIFSEVAQDMIRGNNLNNLAFIDMHMTRQKHTVTQGIVVSVTAGELILNIHEGFPTPLDIFNQTLSSGRYLRKYTNSLTNPQVIQTDNNQVAWGWRSGIAKLPMHISGNIWKIYLNSSSTNLTNYVVGDFVGIKSKHEGETFFICGGNNILFENIKWTHSTRGVARCGTSNITLRGCRIERGEPINGQTPCLSSPSGGPQLNQPNDPTSLNLLVENCYIDSPGDDCVGIFNVDNCKVINSTLLNSFARGIYIDPTATNVCILNNTITNNPIQGDYTTCYNSPPSVEIIELQDTTDITHGQTMYLKADANDELPGLVSSVSFFNGEILLGTDITSPYNVELINATVGYHSITAKATDNYGTTSTSIAKVIKVIPLIDSNTPICEGASLMLNASGGTSFAWSGPNSFISAVQNPIISDVNLNNSGIYSVTITGINGLSYSSSIEVQVNSLPILNLNNPLPVSEPNTINLSSTSIITGSILPINTILSYHLDSMGLLDLPNPNQVKASGIYFIKAANFNCSVIKPINAIINSLKDCNAEINLKSIADDYSYGTSTKITNMNITATNKVVDYAQVILKSNKSILLLPNTNIESGFIANPKGNGYFLAEIDTCK